MPRLVKKREVTLSEDQTTALLEDVLASERKDRSFFDQGRTNRDFLKGLQYVDETGSVHRDHGPEHKIIVNLVHSHIRSLLPTIFFREPTVVAKPINPLQSGKEYTWELVLNGTLRGNGYKKETKATTFDALVYHEGWKKISQIIPEDEEQSDAAGDKGFTETTQVTRGPMPWGSKQTPVSIRISPLAVIVDLLAPGRDPDHARFVAIKYQRPLSEMRADDRYTIPDDLEQDDDVGISRASLTEERFDETKDTGLGQESMTGTETTGVPMLTFYEVYVYQDVDRKLYKQTVWLAIGAKEPIRMATWEDLVGPKFPGWPLHRLVFNPVPDDLPMSETEVWQQLQEAINWVTSKLVSFINVNNQRYVMDDSAFVKAEAAREQMRSGRTIEIIQVKSGAKVAEAISEVPRSPISQDTYRLLDILITFIDRISQLGQNQQQLGGVFRTATEANIVAQASNVRGNERVDIMHDFLLADITKIMHMIRMTVDENIIFRLAGDLGQVDWRTITPMDLQWEPEIEIRVDSFRDMDVPQEMAKWLQIFNLGAQMLPVMGPVVRLDVIFEKLLKAAKVPNPEEIVGNLVGAREYQMLEIMQMMLGTYVPPQAHEPHGEHISSIRMFINSPIWSSVSPEIQSYVLQHLQEHEGFLQQNREQMNGQPQTLGENPIDVLSPAQTARQQSGLTREAQRTGGRDQQEFF